MKVKVKTLTQKEFDLTVEPDDTVLSVKEKIQEHEGFKVETQRLIHSGNILIDTSKLSDDSVKDGDVLVVMSTKTAPKKGMPSPKQETAAASVGPQGTPAAQQQQNTPKEGAAAATPPVQQSDGGGQVNEALVRQLTDMGFPWNEAEAALRAAFMNPDRAVEYLTHGIPEGLQMEESATLTAQDGQKGAVDQPKENPLLFLLQQPQFLQMRALVQSNPQSLLPLLEELGKTNPALLQLINDNQDAFYDIINDTSAQPVTAGEGHGAGMGGVSTIQVTPAEGEAIERLMALGFDRQMVLEAYLACDKNEELAANYLMDNSNWN